MTAPHTDVATSPGAEQAARARIGAMLEVARQPSWWGGWMLFVKELRRFWSISGQTVVSPIITTMLYFLVFGYSLGERLQTVGGVRYVDFLVPGLVMLSIVNNAYINSAFSLFITKIHGTIVDMLVTPLSHTQWLLAYSGASLARSLLVGGVIWGVALLMGANATAHIGMALLFMVLASLAFGFLGVVVAILGKDFDHINLLPSFLIAPLTFLGGVFYSVEMLPAPWKTVSLFNPILYMVNGLRYGMTGESDVAPWVGVVVLVVMNIGFGGWAMWLLRTGKRLRE